MRVGTGRVAFKIDKGYCEEVRLDDLAVVATFYCPRAIHHGQGVLQPILDERADAVWSRGSGKGPASACRKSTAVPASRAASCASRGSPGRGTTVRILLPEARRSAWPESGTTIDPANVRGADQDRLGKVLVIDDDEDVRRIFVEGLEAHGYRVYEAANDRALSTCSSRAWMWMLRSWILRCQP